MKQSSGGGPNGNDGNDNRPDPLEDGGGNHTENEEEEECLVSIDSYIMNNALSLLGLKSKGIDLTDCCNSAYPNSCRWDKIKEGYGFDYSQMDFNEKIKIFLLKYNLVFDDLTEKLPDYAECLENDNFEDCILLEDFWASFGKPVPAPQETSISLLELFLECFGEEDENDNYVDCNLAGNKNFSVTIYSDRPIANSRSPFSYNVFAGADVGHSFLSVQTDFGGGKVATFGFYPSIAIDLDNTVADGAIYDDGLKVYTSSYTSNLNCGQFNEVLKMATYLSSNTYDLESFNCTTFAIDVFNASGDAFPKTVSDWEYNEEKIGSGCNPGDLGEDIKEFEGNGILDEDGGESPSTNCN